MPPESERLLMPPFSGRHTGVLAGVYADPDVTRYIGGAGLDARGTTTQMARSRRCGVSTAAAGAR